MNSRDLVMKAIHFDNPERIPIEAWVLPAAWIKHGERLQKLYNEADLDIVGLPFKDPTEHPRQYNVGTYTDAWGCEWHVLQEGMAGEVKKSPLEDYSNLESYKSPKHLIKQLPFNENCADFCKKNRHKFIRGGWINVFERMQFLRGIENLYIDIAEENEQLFILRDIVVDYWDAYIDKILQYDVDAVTFGDDWGTQVSLLISVDKWRRIFKPAYQKLFQKVKSKGKYVFFHSDGNTLRLYDEFIDLGVDVLNSQIWCIGIDNVAKYRGKICFWGEISRQTILPYGTPDDVRAAAAEMKEKLTYNGGGLIGQSELDAVMPIENIEAFFNAWN